MEVFTRHDLDGLLQSPPSPCVSLFVPTQPGGGDQERLLVNNLLDQTEAVLHHRGLRATAAADFVEPVRRLVDDPVFRRGFDAGLAVYLARERRRAYRLPLSFVPQAVVAEHFQVTPLLPLVNDGRFFALAIGPGRARLFEGTRLGARETDPEALPTWLRGALSIGLPETGRRGDFFRALDLGQRELLRAQRCPLVLAAPEELWPAYRRENHYPHLLPEALPLGSEPVTAQEVHRRAWPLVDRCLRAARAEALARYAGLRGSGRTVDDLSAIAEAARDGGVEDLLVPVDQPCWGATNCVARGVLCAKLHRPGDEDPLNAAARHTLLHGGAVYGFEADEAPPDGLLPAAVLRAGHAWAPAEIMAAPPGGRVATLKVNDP